MKVIWRVLVILSIATVFSHLPLSGNIQTSAAPRVREKATSLSGTTPKKINLLVDEQNQVTQEYHQSLFEITTPEVLSIPTAYGVPGYFNLPESVGGETSDRLADVLVIRLGDKDKMQPYYKQGDAFVQNRLLEF
ncbi:MAG: hypothetical protein QNJ47_07400 [Nostocaceae cyanobacterium]|nr:hypothetical protein [Nostocaceae cyanobacterium]